MGKMSEKKKGPSKGRRKFIKIFLLVVLACLLVAGSFFLMVFYLQSKDPFHGVATEILTVGMFDDGTYYISKAKEDIKFAVDSAAVSYRLEDKNGKEVPSRIIKKNGKNYIVSRSLYTQGETYSLELEDGAFSDDVLKDANRVEFKIEEEEHAVYDFSDDVVQIPSSNIHVEDENQITLQRGDVDPGQIILVRDDETIQDAYQVDSVSDGIIHVSKPEVADIYDELDMYVEDVVSFDNMVINSDLEDEISRIAMSSPIYQYLVMDVYADSKDSDKEPSVSLKTDGNKITIDVKFVLKANGKKKMGIDALKDHDFSITFSYSIGAQYSTKIEKDSSINFDLATITSSSIKFKLESGNEYLKGIENISDKEYSKSIEEIVKKLQKEVPDVSSNSVDIGAVELPTPIPGVHVFIDVYFQCQLSVVVNVDLELKSENVQHVGFIIGPDETRAYQNVSQDNFSVDFSITGKEEVHVGVGLDVGVSIINKDIASASMGVEFGAYQTAFATLKINYETGNNDLHGGLIAKIEEGLYLKLKVTANLNVLFFKASLEADLDEIKYPVFTYGSSEVVTSISSSVPVLVLDSSNRVVAPDITRNITNLDTGSSRSEECSNDDITFQNADGENITGSGNYLSLGKNEDTKIYAVYEWNNQIFKVEITVLKQGSSAPSSNNSNSSSSVSIDAIGSLSIHGNSSAIKAYRQYLLNQNYVTDYQSYFTDSGVDSNYLYDVGYCIFDINQDGVEELVMKANAQDWDQEWDMNAIYTYQNNKVVLVDIIYNYGGIRYDTENLEIVYSETRPTMVTGGYGFYRLSGNKLVLSKSVGHDRGAFIDGEYEYDNHFYFDSDGNRHNITADEENSYYDNVVPFSYQDVTNVN